MKNLITLLILLLASSAILAADKPFRAQATSPDKLWRAVLEPVDLTGNKTPSWQLHLVRIKTKVKDNLVSLATQDVAHELEDDDAWGFYDIAWSPDSRYLSFVFRPFSSQSIGHSQDCIGIIDIVTKQYEWLAGPVTDGFQSDLFGSGRPDYRLKWVARGTVSFYLSETQKDGKVRAAGVRKVEVIKIRQEFYAREVEIRALGQRIIKVMQGAAWRQGLKPLFAKSEGSSESIELLAECQKKWVNAKGIEFVWYTPSDQSFAIVFPLSKEQASPFIVGHGKIIDIPMDLD